MPRGGPRPNSGRKSPWIHTPTQTIRVPSAFADQLLEVAHQLDQGEVIGSVSKSDIDSDTKSNKVIDFVIKSFSMSTLALSERLGVPRNTMKRQTKSMTDEELARWTQERDPDGFAWERCEEPSFYRPIV